MVDWEFVSGDIETAVGIFLPVFDVGVFMFARLVWFAGLHTICFQCIFFKRWFYPLTFCIDSSIYQISCLEENSLRKP